MHFHTVVTDNASPPRHTTPATIASTFPPHRVRGGSGSGNALRCPCCKWPRQSCGPPPSTLTRSPSSGRTWRSRGTPGEGIARARLCCQVGHAVNGDLHCQTDVVRDAELDVVNDDLRLAALWRRPSWTSSHSSSPPLRTLGCRTPSPRRREPWRPRWENETLKDSKVVQDKLSARGGLLPHRRGRLLPPRPLGIGPSSAPSHYCTMMVGNMR
jgi:hypothetical protein